MAAGENVYSYAPNVWGWIDPLGLHKKGKATPGVSKVTNSNNNSGKVLGGKFKDVDACRGADEVGHHMAQNAYNKTIGISRNDGPALLMSKEDHELTRTFKYKGAQTMKDDVGLSARQRMELDIQDIRTLFGNKYDEGIEQMLEYANTLPSAAWRN